jgi:hypothetical protein
LSTFIASGISQKLPTQIAKLDIPVFQSDKNGAGVRGRSSDAPTCPIQRDSNGRFFAAAVVPMDGNPLEISIPELFSLDFTLSVVGNSHGHEIGVQMCHKASTAF